MRHFIYSLVLSILMAFVAANAQEKGQADSNQIPKKVMDGLRAKFPNAQIDKWTREEEGDIFVYDIEFKQEEQKFEADIKEDGTIHNWEKAIVAKNLPVAVRKTVEKKYPKAAIVEIMEITAVKDGKDLLEGYEIVLKTHDKKDVEVTMAPDGKVLEDSGDKK